MGILRLARTKARKQNGFTLAELVVVLVIMALLTAALIPVVTGYVGDAKTKVADSNVKMVEEAARLYIVDKDLAGKSAVGTVKASELAAQGYLSDLKGEEEYTVTIALVEGSSTKYNIEIA